MGKRHLFWFCTSFVATAMLCMLCRTALVFLCFWIIILAATVFFLCRENSKAAAVVVLIAALFSLIRQYTFIMNDELPRDFFINSSEAYAEVVSYPQRASSGKFTIRAELTYEKRKINALVYTGEDISSLVPGDIICMNANLYELENNEYFAQKTYYKSRYTDVMLFASELKVTEKTDKVGMRYIPGYLAMRFKDKIDEIYESPSSEFIRSLLMGDTSGLDYDFRKNLSSTGMSHAVSVSGLHISFILGLFLYFSKNRYVKLAVMPLVFLFVLMVGAPQSALRAVIMQALVVVSGFTKREYDQLTALLFAAFILVVLNPYCVTDSAFLLSFSATMGIIVLYPKIRAALERITVQKISILRRLSVGAVSVAAVSLSATVFTSPLTAYLFDSVSVIGPVVNVILNVFISAIFSIGFLNTMLGFIFPSIAGLGAYIIDFFVGVIMNVINAMASLPFADVFTGELVILFLICFICAVLVYAISVGKEKIRVFFSVCAIAFAIISSLAAGVFSGNAELQGEGIRFDVLDVGQGQCIVATSGETCVVIDCGGDEPADNIAISHLLSRGISDIDALILTHAHADHANGAEYLIKSVDTKTIYMPATDRENAAFVKIVDSIDKECDAVFVEKDTAFEFPGMTIKLLTLPQGSDENENGLVILVCDGEYEALITGDIATSNEKLILDRLPDCESYIVGHHGSKTSSSQAMLNRALPELSVVSVGIGNSYGHPSVQALRRLENIGSVVKRTDIDGTVTFYSGKTGESA